MLSPRHSYSNSNDKKLSGPHEDILQNFAICTNELEREREREREKETERETEREREREKERSSTHKLGLLTHVRSLLRVYQVSFDTDFGT